MTLNASGISPPYVIPGGVLNAAYFGYTGDGSGSITVNLGFVPSKVKINNLTDQIAWEWNAGMPLVDSVKTVANGTVTTDTSGLISAGLTDFTYNTAGIYQPGSQGPGDGTLINTTLTIRAPDKTKSQLVLATGLNTSAKVYSVECIG